MDPLMSKRAFTLQAELLWHTVPASAKKRVLQNVYCGGCRGTAEMIDYTGSVKNGDVLLKGACAKCGRLVVRVVETSEAPPPNN